MKIFQYKIEHPGTAFVIIFLVSAFLSNYGAVEGVAMLLALFLGILIYKFVTFRN